MTVTDTTQSSGLPPYSGEETPCPKCSNTRARTTWRPAVGRRTLSDLAHGGPLPERLERECERCDFQWDEALCPPGCGMTVEALAHAIDNSTPYPVELHTEVCTYMARYLLECLHVGARPDHPLWQYDEGRPPEQVEPTPAESCPPTAPAPEPPADEPVTLKELAGVLYAAPQAPPTWALDLSPECALHMAEQILKSFTVTRRTPAQTADAEGETP